MRNNTSFYTLIITLMDSSSFIDIISKLFVPVKDLANSLTQDGKNIPFQTLSPGSEFSLCDHKFYHRSNRLMEAAMYASTYVPVSDQIVDMDPIQMIHNFQNNYGKLLLHTDILDNNNSLEATDKNIGDHSSDARLTEMIKQGPAALLIEHHDEFVFKIDLNNMSKYHVRTGFIRYGGCLLFNDDYQLLSIEYNEVKSKPGDKNWNKFKFIFKSSLLAHLVIRIHACYYHLVYGSCVPQTISQLSTDNDIRVLMAPFVYHNLEAAASAKSVLFGEGRYFHRLFAFQFLALEVYIKDGFDSFQHVNFSDNYRKLSKFSSKIVHTPYFLDSSRIFDIYRSFVDKYVQCSTSEYTKFSDQLQTISGGKLSILAPEDNHKKSKSRVTTFLANYIFLGTVHHELIGNSILKWQYDPRESSVKLRDFPICCDVATYEQTMLIVCGTVMGRVPMLMDDLSNYFSNYGIEKFNVYQLLRKQLSILANDIDKDNESRIVPFFGAHPMKLESTFSQ